MTRQAVSTDATTSGNGHTPSTAGDSAAEDDALMLRVQSGDEAAFAQLVEKYQRQLVGFFVRNTRDVHRAEDLAQETLLKVFDHAWDYLPRGKFRGWMYRIGRHLMIDDARRRSHDALVKAGAGSNEETPDTLSLLVADVMPPQRVAAGRELQATVDELLMHLPEEQRLVFTLFHLAGLSLPEIADAMEVKLATCKSRLRLAREKLQVWLCDRGVLDPNDDGSEE